MDLIETGQNESNKINSNSSNIEEKKKEIDPKEIEKANKIISIIDEKKKN